MINYKSFQIIFEEADGQTHSATFDVAIPLECKGKFVDIKGKVYDMRKYHRTLYSESTSLNIIHKATVAPEDPNICKASDPNLSLTKTEGMYIVTTEKQLKNVCKCTSIDYISIMNCSTCTQETLNNCKLNDIYGANSSNESLILRNTAFSDLSSFAKVSGDLEGAIIVQSMNNLISLDGLQNIRNLESAKWPYPLLTVMNNKILTNAMALNNVNNLNLSSNMLIQNNPKLACVPDQWPTYDGQGLPIRPPENKCPIKPVGFYNAVKGDTCGKIAYKFCGNTAKCYDPPNEKNCPSICNSLNICTNLHIGQPIWYDCNNERKYCYNIS